MTTLLLAAAACLTWAVVVRAQEKPDNVVAQETPAAEPPPSGAEKLAQDQRQILAKYRHLDDVLLRMAELSAATDPRRAALLKKALAQSKDRLTAVRIEKLVDLLSKDQLSEAMENQTEVDQDLRALLELLQSENREKRIESEKARVREYLKRLNLLIQQQKDIQGRTAGGDDAKRLSGQQGKVSEKTGELSSDIQKNEEAQAGAKKETDKPASQPAEGGKPAEEQPKEDETEKQDAPPEDSSENPARKRLDAARQRMKEAEAKLDEAKRQDAAEKQEEALAELQRAKAELEKILRQLREEEVERTLAMLEARFRKMLQMQEEVYEGTVRLDKVPAKERTHNHEIEASRLSAKESSIVVEIDKALLVLRDDGSAVAFLESSEQLRDDMLQVVDRLARADVGKITQDVELDILAALKEMIEALKKAQKEPKKSRGASPSGMPGEPPLVDVLAELKMIRALQMRVNTRTDRYSKMIEGEQAENAELVEAIRRLAERQQRIYRVTHDLETGKNQ